MSRTRVAEAVYVGCDALGWALGKPHRLLKDYEVRGFELKRENLS